MFDGPTLDILQFRFKRSLVTFILLHLSVDGIFLVFL